MSEGIFEMLDPNNLPNAIWEVLPDGNHKNIYYIAATGRIVRITNVLKPSRNNCPGNVGILTEYDNIVSTECEIVGIYDA